MSLLDRSSPEEAMLKLKEGDLRERVRAAKRLAKTGGPSVVEALTAALGDSESRVNQALIEALGQLGKPAADSLRAAAEQEEPSSYRAGVLGETLASIGDPSAVGMLTTVLETGDLPARKQAASALGKRGGEEAVGPLMKALKDDDPDLRACVEQSLGTLRKNTNRPFLGRIFPVSVPVDLQGGTADLRISLVRFDDEDVMHNLEQAEERLAELGLRAASELELRSFGAAYPDIQVWEHIYAIGSSKADHVVPYLWGIPGAGGVAEVFGGTQRKESRQRFEQTPLSETRRYLLATPAAGPRQLSGQTAGVPRYKVKCPGCSAELLSPAGDPIKCPKCGYLMKVWGDETPTEQPATKGTASEP